MEDRPKELSEKAVQTLKEKAIEQLENVMSKISDAAAWQDFLAKKRAEAATLQGQGELRVFLQSMQKALNYLHAVRDFEQEIKATNENKLIASAGLSVQTSIANAVPSESQKIEIAIPAASEIGEQIKETVPAEQQKVYQDTMGNIKENFKNFNAAAGEIVRESLGKPVHEIRSQAFKDADLLTETTHKFRVAVKEPSTSHLQAVSENIAKISDRTSEVIADKQEETRQEAKKKGSWGSKVGNWLGLSGPGVMMVGSLMMLTGSIMSLASGGLLAPIGGPLIFAGGLMALQGGGLYAAGGEIRNREDNKNIKTALAQSEVREKIEEAKKVLHEGQKVMTGIEGRMDELMKQSKDQSQLRKP